MKQSIIVIAMLLFCTGFLFVACKKTGGAINPLSSVNNNGIGAYLVLDSNINLNLNSVTISSSTIGIVVHAYPGGEPVDKIILYSTTTPSFDTSQWHLVKTVSYTAPATSLTLTGAELAQSLGVTPSSLAPGSNFTIYTRIVTKSGSTFDVSNTGDNSGSGLISGAAYNSAFFFTAFVVCPYTAGSMAGNYTLTRDDWQDYAVPAIINGAVTEGPGANQISLHVYPGPGAGIQTGPMLVDIDPLTGNAIIEKSTIGTYGGATTTVTGSGHVFSCTGLITLNVDFVVGGADQGGFTMTMQKN